MTSFLSAKSEILPSARSSLLLSTTRSESVVGLRWVDDQLNAACLLEERLHSPSGSECEVAAPDARSIVSLAALHTWLAAYLIR